MYLSNNAIWACALNFKCTGDVCCIAIHVATCTCHFLAVSKLTKSTCHFLAMSEFNKIIKELLIFMKWREYTTGDMCLKFIQKRIEKASFVSSVLWCPNKIQIKSGVGPFIYQNNVVFLFEKNLHCVWEVSGMCLRCMWLLLGMCPKCIFLVLSYKPSCVWIVQYLSLSVTFLYLNSAWMALWNYQIFVTSGLHIS